MCWSGTSTLKVWDKHTKSLSATCGLNRINWQGLAQWRRPESTHDFCVDSVNLDCDMCDMLAMHPKISLKNENGCLLLAPLLDGFLCVLHSDSRGGYKAHWGDLTCSFGELFRYQLPLYHLPRTGHTNTGPAEHSWSKQRGMYPSSAQNTLDCPYS